MSNVGASLRPEDAANGGFMDAVEALITNIRFVDRYPNGSPSTLLEVTYAPLDGSKERTELYRAGPVEKIRPSADGKQLVPADARMHKSSGAIKWISAIITAGFPASRVSQDVTVFAGTKVFLKREALPKTGNAEIDAKDRDILLVSKVLALPEEAKPVVKPAVAAAAKRAATKAVAVAPVTVPEPVAADGAVDDAIGVELEAIITALLTAAPDNTIPRNRIGNTLFQFCIKTKRTDRAKLMPLAANEEWLAGERPWAYDGEQLVLIPAA